MSELEHGIVVSVAEIVTGDELAVAAPAGSLTLELVDAVDFAESGGVLKIGDEIIGYSSADLDADFVQLDTATAVAYDVGEPVLVQPDARERVATVQLDEDGEAIEARVPHGLYDRIDEGIRDVPEHVSLDLDGATWVVVDVIGREPVIDGSFIDDTTLPQPRDGTAPALSPTPTVLGGVGVLHVRWPGAINADAVTYEVHVSTQDGFTVDSSTLAVETSSTSVTLKTLPDGSPLTYGPESAPTVYFVKLVAKDIDGAAPPSAQASASLYRITNDEVSALFAYFGAVSADQLTAGDLDAAVTLSGVIKTADQGRRVVIDATGMKLYPQSGSTPLVELPTDDASDAVFTGSATMRTLTVTDSMALQSSDNHVRSTAVLELDSSVTAPSTGPGFAIGHDLLSVTNVVPPPQKSGGVGGYVWGRGFHVDADELLLAIAGDYDPGYGGNPSCVAIAPPSGGDVTSYWYPFGTGATSVGGTHDVCKLGGAYFALGATSVDASTPVRLRRFDSTKTQTHEVTLARSTYDAFGICTDGTYIYMLTEKQGEDRIYVRRYNAADLTGAVETSTALTDVINSTGFGGAVGSFDFGAARLLAPITTLARHNAAWRDVQVFSGTSAYVLQPAESFPGKSASHAVESVKWDTTRNAFLTHQARSVTLSNGVGQIDFAVHTGIKWTAAADATWWLSSAFARYDAADALVAQTPQSSRVTLTMTKRAKLTVTGPPVPPDDPAYEYDPTHARIFIGKGTSEPARTSMYYVARTTNAVPSVDIKTMPSFAGTDNPPSSSTFPDSTPGKIISGIMRSDGVTPRTMLDGIGGARVDGLIPPGTVVMWAGSAAPAGWALCDGTTKSRTLDKPLFDVIGTAFGAGDGSTTFNLPDFEDRFPIGAGVKARGTAGGSSTKTLTAANLPPHVHGSGSLSVSRRAAAGAAAGAAKGNSVVDGDINVTGNTDNGPGTSAAFDVLNPYRAIHFIIKL